MLEAQILEQKQCIANAFAAAAAYDQHAVVQRQAARRLAERIIELKLPDQARICEVGCGTGFLGEAIGKALANASWLATDICPEMVERARARLAGDDRFEFAVADAEAPASLRSAGPFDLICSSFAAQWFADLRAALEQLTRLLHPGGHLVLTTLADGTYWEWRQAHESLGLQVGTPPYPSIAELRAMRPGGFAMDVSSEVLTEAFGEPRQFLDAVRTIGAQTPAAGHAPLNAGQMRRVLRNFATTGCQATYVVATCALQRPPAPRWPDPEAVRRQ